MKKAILFTMAILAIISKASAQESRRQWHQREAFQTETPMVHDPVIAKEGDTYYIYATGMGIRKNGKLQATALPILSTARTFLSVTAIVPPIMERPCSSSVLSAGRQMDGQS
jgi:hypothetical protein